MKKKGLVATIATAALCVATLFCGCSNKDATMLFVDTNKNANDATRISFYGYKHNKGDLVAIEHSIHKFMDIHPDINVNYEGLPNDKSANNYFEIFDLRYANGHLDDVFMIKQDNRTEAMIENGDFLNLKNVIDVDAYSDLVKSQIMYPDLVNEGDYNIYFVPMSLSAYCMYINYDLLKSDGQKIPTNFEEFSQVCNFYVNKYATQNKQLCPIICNNNRSLRTIVQAYGTFDLYHLENSESVIDSFNTDPLPFARDYLYPGLELANRMLANRWIDASKTKITTQGSVKESENGDMYEFMKGEQPFMISGGWATNRITDEIKNKNLNNINYGVHPLPLLSKEKGGSVLVFDVDVCTGVNANSKKLDAAKEFISYFTSPESVWEFCNTNNSYSPIASETRKPTNKTLAPHIDYYTNGQSVLATNYRLYFDSNKVIDAATAKLLNGESLKVAYDQLLAGLGL